MELSHLRRLLFLGGVMEAIPFLLGGDLNCYGMAAAFYEAGIPRSYALGRYRLGVTSFSRFVRPVIDERMNTDGGRIQLIRELAARHPGSRPILIGCTDEYASFLIRSQRSFDERYIIPSPPAYTLKYADKARFFEEMVRRQIASPRTVLLNDGDSVPESVPFLYPAVLKPASSEQYWHHPFDGMKKVWFPRDSHEAEAILARMRGAGYRGTVLLQERIPVADTDNYVLTAYCDRFASVRTAVFGRVLLEEHTPRGLGNHAAILTEPMPMVCRQLLTFLEAIGYRGFANFDLLRHPKSGELFVLEMNLRQGRSNHYMTAAGCNPAALVLADRVLGETLPYTEGTLPVLWHSVPLGVLYSQIRDRELLARCRELERAGRAVSALGLRTDLWHNPLRRLFVWEHERRIRRRARLAPVRG